MKLKDRGNALVLGGTTCINPLYQMDFLNPLGNIIVKKHYFCKSFALQIK